VASLPSGRIFQDLGSTWTEQQKLVASDGAADDWFGFRLAASGDTLVIAAPYGDDNGNSSGAAYVYGYDGAAWFLKAKLLASDGAVRDAFGDTLDISDDYLLIGAHGDDDNGQTSHPGHRTAQIFISPYMNGVSGSSGPPALAGSAHRLGIKDQKGP
jgi:hypothetical protein